MKAHIVPAIKAHLFRGAFYLLLLMAVWVIAFGLGQQQASAQSCTGWSTGSDMPSTGVRMVGVYFPASQKFYAVGGRSMDGIGNDFTHPFEYDPVSNTWTIKSATYPDNQVSDMACGVLTNSGTDYIYCVGGSAGGQTTATNRVFRYNPITDTINSVPSTWPGDNDGITLPGGFTVFQNKLYILGGFQINTATTDQIWEFDPGTNTWVQKSAVLGAPLAYVPTATIGGFIYTAGGAAWNGTTLVDQSDAYFYDPLTDVTGGIPTIPRATSETRALTFNEGAGANMWVMGGGRTPPNPSNEVDICCWTTGAPFMTARRDFPTDTDGTTTIWLAGGYASDGITPLRSMEIFCNAGSTPTPTPTPSATATATPTAKPTSTRSPCPCQTPTPMPRPTPAPRPTPHTPTPTATGTPSPTLTPSATPAQTRPTPTPRPRPFPCPPHCEGTPIETTPLPNL